MDQTGVYNLALGRVGVGQVIASPTENSVPAKTCNRFYEQCRQEVLRAHPWGFASRSEALALVAGQTYPGWGYVYQVPHDSLIVRSVGDETGMRWIRGYSATGGVGGLRRDDAWLSGTVARIPWQIALKDDGSSQVILTDVSDAWAFFTADADNPGAWSVDFGGLLAWRLAMEIAAPLQASSTLVDRAEQRYTAWFSQAAAASMNEQKDDSRIESPSISSRM